MLTVIGVLVGLVLIGPALAIAPWVVYKVLN